MNKNRATYLRDRPMFEPYGLPVLNHYFETTLIHRTLFEATHYSHPHVMG